MDSTAEENDLLINHHQWFVEDFEKQDQQLLKRSMRNPGVCRVRCQSHFVFQLVNLISGIWGTYNEIYTRQQLDQLHRDLTKVEEHQDQLFAVTSAHQAAILQLNTAISALLDSTMRKIANPSSVTNVTLQRLWTCWIKILGKLLVLFKPRKCNAFVWTSSMWINFMTFMQDALLLLISIIQSSS